MSGYGDYGELILWRLLWRLFEVDAITREQLAALLAKVEAERRAEFAMLNEQNRRASQRFDALPPWRRLCALARYGSRAEYVRRTGRLEPGDNRTEEQ